MGLYWPDMSPNIFDDLWLHLSRLLGLLARGAEAHYIVENSSCYGILVPTVSFYADVFRALGFGDVTCRPLRKRNSKKALIEFDGRRTGYDGFTPPLPPVPRRRASDGRE